MRLWGPQRPTKAFGLLIFDADIDYAFYERVQSLNKILYNHKSDRVFSTHG